MPCDRHADQTGPERRKRARAAPPSRPASRNLAGQSGTAPRSA